MMPPSKLQRQHAAAMPSCTDNYDPAVISVQQALHSALHATKPVKHTEVCTLKAALGRVLAEDIISRMNVPGHTNSAMDGYAIRSSDIPAAGMATLKQVGNAFAGQPFCGTVAAGECVRIMTGAVMPDACDTVVIQEQVTTGNATIEITANNKPGQNVRQAGEDIIAGAKILTRGRRILPADLGLLASCGVTQVLVKRKPKVAFFSTGDELVPCGKMLAPGQIYDSNSYTIHGMLSRLGVETIDLGIVPDTRETLIETLREKTRSADAFITSGGASVGAADLIKETLEQLGQVYFWKVAVKPGRPIAFGRINHALYFGLPGNPVSVMVVFYILVQPALKKLAGESPVITPRTLRAQCTDDLRKRPGRIEYQRGLLTQIENGNYQVRKTGAQGSGVLSSMAYANCFIVLPVHQQKVAAGDWVEVIPFDCLI